MYDIAYDSRDRILHIVQHGFWSLSTLAGFSAKVLARGTQLRLSHGHFAVLADLRAAPIQPVALIAPCQVMMRKATVITAGPIAIVLGSALGKI